MSRIRLAVLLAFGLAACTGAGGPTVEIRIHNAGSEPFENVWLGAGGPDLRNRPVPYGRLRPGETTRYKPHAAVLARYRKIDVLLPGTGRRHVEIVRPDGFFGTPELAPGRYTFHVAPDLDPTLRITRDDDPPP